MELTFHGGAKSVTGANYLLEAGGLKLLVDCGLCQGSRYSEIENYSSFMYNPAEIDCVLITHSHIDHIGRLPKLYKDGFRGVVYMTEPTAAIAAIALPDTLGKIADEARSDGHPPLFTQEDVDGLLKLIQPMPYRRNLVLNPRISVEFFDVSHILGSASIKITVHENADKKVFVFTGDVGNPPTLLLKPIDYIAGADYVIIESAYGNRFHENRQERRDILEHTILQTIKRGGVLMIPSFAVERTQELLLELDNLIIASRIPKIPIFLDSPLAIKITKAYGDFSHYFNPEAVEILKPSRGLFSFPWLTFTMTTAESKKINETPSPKIIIAGSGMSMGGRVLHHESRYLPDSKNTILFVGFQVAGSLGRRILDGEPVVSIFGQKIDVRCNVKAIGAYSAHADQNGLLEYLAQAGGKNLKQVFVVQGEDDSATALAAAAGKRFGVPAQAPHPGQTVQL